MNIENTKVTGRLTIRVISEGGEIRHELDVPNLIVTTGKNFIASRMKDASLTTMSHMAIGDGSSTSPGTPTAAALTDTALGNEKARVTLTSTTVTANQIVYTANYPANTPSASCEVCEAGIFNASTAGTMLCRTTFTKVTKATTDAMTITWTVTVS